MTPVEYSSAVQVLSICCYLTSANDDIAVTLEDDILRIHAEKKQEDEHTENNWRVVERFNGTYERSIRVPSGIDSDAIAADLDKGVLTITLPKPLIWRHRKRARLP